jgi:nucleoside-diphosphate-sugar epimerase
MSELHVIFGAGPVGCWTARALRELHIPVRAINRRGQRPERMPEDVEMVAADASDSKQAIAAAQGAAVVYQALNPPYHQWQTFFPALQANALAAASTAGARYVSIENLYMYDSSKPITEDSPVLPKSQKGALRAKMADEVLAAHQRGEIRATALRASDYYGPGVLASALGERVFGNLVAGKKAQLSGSANRPHSWAYIEDVGRAAAILGTREQALGKAWIAPHAAPVTQGQAVEMACQILGIEPRFSVLSPFMMRLGGLFIPAARASVEMMYQFSEPFIVDSRKFEQTFQVKATPMEEGIRKAVDWYRATPN